MHRTRTLTTHGVVNDKTAEKLTAWGWKNVPSPWGRGPHDGHWIDPTTGRRYTISQAEAIRRDRQAPRYRFATEVR